MLARILTLLVGGAISALLLVYFAGRIAESPDNPVAARSAAGRDWKKADIHVAVVWTKSDDAFLRGVRLKIGELRNRSGFDRQKDDQNCVGHVCIVVFDEPEDGDAEQSWVLAEEIARDRTIVAVLGHRFSSTAIPASVVYERNGILFITATASNPVVTHHGFQGVFRLGPGDDAIAKEMVTFARNFKKRDTPVVSAAQDTSKEPGASKPSDVIDHETHHLNLALFYSLNPDIISLVPQVQANATLGRNGQIHLVSRFYRGTDPLEATFRRSIARIPAEDMDAILVGDEMPRAVDLIRQIRELGIVAPIIGNDNLDRSMVWTQQAASGVPTDVYVASGNDPEPQASASEYNKFRQALAEQNRRRKADKTYVPLVPGYAVALGYDAVNLLTGAVAQAKSFDPLAVATALHLKTFPGLFGAYRFSDTGVGQNMPVLIKHLKQDGSFETCRKPAGKNWGDPEFLGLGNACKTDVAVTDAPTNELKREIVQ